MDDIQLILYILFLVGYFIFKLITGKGKSGPQGGDDTFDTGNAPHAPRRQEGRSLEDILDEIVTGERKEPRPEPVAVEMKEENKERDSWYDDDTFSEFELAVASAQKHKTLQQKVAESEIKIGEVEDLDEVEAENVGSNSYLGMFKNLEDAQKAVVMSEIINRKY